VAEDHRYITVKMVQFCDLRYLFRHTGFITLYILTNLAPIPKKKLATASIAVLLLSLLATVSRLIPMSNSEEERKVLRRADVGDFIRRQGLPIAENTLDNLATQGRGPKFTYSRGGTRYTEEDLLAFVEAEKARRARRY
jgi:hypothetical protein